MMDLRDEQARLDAFADGELDEAQHAQDAARFRSDPQCQCHTSGVASLKNALAEAWSAELAPTDLRDRIVEALEEAPAPQATTPDGTSATHETPQRRTTWSPRRVSLVAMAATIALVALIWQLWPEQRHPLVQVTQVAPRILQSPLDLHAEAVSDKGVIAGERLVATSVADAQRILTQALEIPVLAPNLTDRGFAFLGASRCVIERFPAAQFLYQHTQSHVLLSVFSVRKLERLRPQVTAAGVLEVFETEVNHTTAVAWHSGPATYLACAALPPVRLRSLLDLSRSARQAWRWKSDLGDLPYLVSSPVSGYDTLQQVPATVTVPVPRQPADASRRPPQKRIRGAEWMALLHRAIVIGCS